MLVFKPQKLFWSTLRALGALYLARERQKIKSIDCFSVRCTAVITDRHTRRRKSGGWGWGRVEYLKKGEKKKEQKVGGGGWGERKTSRVKINKAAEGREILLWDRGS